MALLMRTAIRGTEHVQSASRFAVYPVVGKGRRGVIVLGEN